MICVNWCCGCACALDDGLRAAVVAEVTLLSEHLIVVVVDDIVAEQVVHSVVVEVVVSDQCALQVVDMVVALVDDRLGDEDVVVVVLQLL